MSEITLHVLIGTALTDSEFHDKLLNGKRRSLLAELDLTDIERKTVMGIEAKSVQEFAVQLCELLPATASVVEEPRVGYLYGGQRQMQTQIVW
jgi:hypothetical protein